jgi:hypothetical protein
VRPPKKIAKRSPPPLPAPPPSKKLRASPAEESLKRRVEQLERERNASTMKYGVLEASSKQKEHE